MEKFQMNRKIVSFDFAEPYTISCGEKIRKFEAHSRFELYAAQDNLPHLYIMFQNDDIYDLAIYAEDLKKNPLVVTSGVTKLEFHQGIFG